MESSSGIIAETISETKQARRTLKYTFFKIDKAWRRLGPEEREKGRQEFLKILNESSDTLTLRFYSLQGTRGDTDFMIWAISDRVERIQEMLQKLLSTKLGGFLDIPYSYLAMSRPSQYTGGHKHEGQEGITGERMPGKHKYLFVYPFVKKREWYKLPFEERRRMMAEHFKIGHKYPSVKINTAYSFGIDDQEFVLSFEADRLDDFLDLVMELRYSDASQYTLLETPIFSCVSVDAKKMLDSI